MSFDPNLLHNNGHNWSLTTWRRCGIHNKDSNDKEVEIDVRLLPQGTVIFEDIRIEHFEGTVTNVIPKALWKKENDPLTGQIEVDFVIPKELPFVATNTKSKVTLLEGRNSNSKRLVSYVATLKDNFEFIETANRCKKNFFPHYSEFSGDVSSLELGDMKEYKLPKGKCSKVSAEKVNKTLSVNGITEEADPTMYSDKIINPLRSVDPTQTEYQEIIEIMEERNMKDKVYAFGIVGMANKGDCLQKRESVKFQLCVLGQNVQTMAYSITTE
ncbi:Cold shock domain-containing protein E1 [Myotis davidii]|uniref:Cold shock domain-containing protein E1 n=1 Tax=Myotis davidii TaxID=225400 RepID=L5LXU1_MYODS|nr:Cold shock domain-containing protein E1 [Myotis davidii]